MTYQKEARTALGPATEFMMSPHNGPPIPVDGWELGAGEVRWGPSKKSEPKDYDQGTAVRIYLTESGGWIVDVRRWRRDDAPDPESTAFPGPAELLDWLRRDGRMGDASLQAWLHTCKTIPSLAHMAEERIP